MTKMYYACNYDRSNSKVPGGGRCDSVTPFSTSLVTVALDALGLGSGEFNSGANSCLPLKVT